MLFFEELLYVYLFLFLFSLSLIWHLIFFFFYVDLYFLVKKKLHSSYLLFFISSIYINYLSRISSGLLLLKFTLPFPSQLSSIVFISGSKPTYGNIFLVLFSSSCSFPFLTPFALSYLLYNQYLPVVKEHFFSNM